MKNTIINVLASLTLILSNHAFAFMGMGSECDNTPITIHNKTNTTLSLESFSTSRGQALLQTTLSENQILPNQTLSLLVSSSAGSFGGVRGRILLKELASGEYHRLSYHLTAYTFNRYCSTHGYFMPYHDSYDSSNRGRGVSIDYIIRN